MVYELASASCAGTSSSGGNSRGLAGSYRCQHKLHQQGRMHQRGRMHSTGGAASPSPPSPPPPQRNAKSGVGKLGTWTGVREQQRLGHPCHNLAPGCSCALRPNRGRASYRTVGCMLGHGMRVCCTCLCWITFSRRHGFVPFRPVMFDGVRSQAQGGLPNLSCQQQTSLLLVTPLPGQSCSCMPWCIAISPKAALPLRSTVHRHSPGGSLGCNQSF